VSFSNESLKGDSVWSVISISSLESDVLMLILMSGLSL